VDAVDRAEHAVELARAQHRGRLFRKPVGLAELNAAQDAQPLELRTAPLYLFEVTHDVD